MLRYRCMERTLSCERSSTRSPPCSNNLFSLSSSLVSLFQSTKVYHIAQARAIADGPNKPSQKRNQTIAGHFGTADFRSRQFKALLDVCGLEWWNVSRIDKCARVDLTYPEAPGEAEAELAVMNRQGKIDAVLSDDVDALLFGATCLLRK